MSDKDPVDDVRKRFEEMLRNSNVNFVLGGQPPAEKQAPPPQGADKADKERAEALRKIREFNLKPRDVRDHLDRYVIRQDEAKKVLSVAICDHYNHVKRCLTDQAFREAEYSKHNVIMLGPTGVGKTYMVRCIARLIGVPFVKADATKFSETGYVGHDVEDLVRDLVRSAGGDTELAQYGIIFLDEIDKIASASSSSGRDVSGRGVQVNLLKLMEETDVGLQSQTDILGQVQAVMDMQRGKTASRTINTRHMLFIVSGAFDGLTDIVRQRVASSLIGFGQPGTGQHSEADLLIEAQTRDFVKFGFEPEFIGRLPVRVVCGKLTANDLELVLRKSEGSVLRQYQADMKGYGIEMSVTDGAISAIAAKAEKENTGARGLMTVFERILRNFKFELPSTGVSQLEIDTATVEDPSTELGRLLRASGGMLEKQWRADIQKYCDAFEKEHGLELKFTPGAVELVMDMCRAGARKPGEICTERFRDLHHGLSLVSRNTGKQSFKISRKLVESPGKELSHMIAESFGRNPQGDSHE